MSSDDEIEDDSSGEIRTIGTDIYYYSDVTRKSVLELIDKLKKLETDLLKKAIDLPGYVPSIRIHIQSDGGDVFSGMSAMDTLNQSRIHITTIAEGSCCSAGTFILLGGKDRRMGMNAHILIHQLSSGGLYGKFEELKDEMDTCKKLMKALRRVYTTETSIPKEKLDELMKRDVYLNAEECIKYGIVHGIA
jgi:ATP-dependent Clp endopeptidase proteolytic subunit ClpP